jgi:hypothetical protein
VRLGWNSLRAFSIAGAIAGAGLMLSFWVFIRTVLPHPPGVEVTAATAYLRPDRIGIAAICGAFASSVSWSLRNSRNSATRYLLPDGER